MTHVDELDTSEPKERPVVESYNPWEEMFKTHYKAPKLDRSWTAPIDESTKDSLMQAPALDRAP
jgi:hypothetical protein